VSADVQPGARRPHEARLRDASAPVSGNAKVIAVGRLTIVASGPEKAFKTAEPYLLAIGEGATYVGEGELARMVKICHNVLLGVVTQNLAEIGRAGGEGGVPRHALLASSITASWVRCYALQVTGIRQLDWTPTFTAPMLRKDLDLALSAAEKLGVPLPVTAATRQLVQRTIDAGHTDCDFGIMPRRAGQGIQA